MAQNYTFPVLETRELLHCFSEIGNGIQLTEQQLMNPTFEHITRIMEQCLDMFMEFCADDQGQIKFSGMDAFDHPELHDLSIGQLAFNRSAMKFMATCGVHDFALKDIYKPEYKRLKFIFSAIINFAKYREDNMPAFETLLEQSESLKQEKAEVDARFEELTRQLHKLRKQRDQEQELVTELQEENEAMEAEIKKFNVEQGALKHKIHEVKEQRQEHSDKRDHLQFALLNLKSEVSKLQGLVVKSPERAKREIVEMQHSAETDAELLREMDEKLQSLRSKVDGLCKTEREVLKLTRQLKDVEECLAKLKAANKDIKRIQTSQGEQDSAMRELTVQEQSLRRQLHNISARAAELDARQRLKREAADREKEKWKNAAAGADKENEAAELEMERMSEESRLAEKRLQDLQNLEQAESSKFAEEKALVEERVRAYNLRILNAISNSAQA